jgi:hypothetical protein
MNRLFARSDRIEEVEMVTGHYPESVQMLIADRRRQGNLFTQSPKLACIKCNTGWMNKYELEMSKILPNIILGLENHDLSPYQTKVFAAWSCLIFMLAPYTTGQQIAIPQFERDYIFNHRLPSTDWSIFAAGINGPEWSQKYNYRAFSGGFANNRNDLLQKDDFFDKTPNCCISSMGFGRIFLHSCYAPINEYLHFFDVSAKKRGLVRVWPPVRGLWPFAQRRLHLPPKFTLSDDEATEISEAFYRRLLFVSSKRERLRLNLQ